MSSRRLSLPSSRTTRAFLWRWRYVACAIGVVFVLNTILSALATEEEHHPAVVAVRDLPAGTYVTEADLTVIDFPMSLDGVATSADDLVGVALIAPVTEGAVIPLSNAMNEEFLHKPRDGHVITAVELANTGGLDLLTTGTYVDVYATPPDHSGSTEATLVARNVRVAGIAVARDQSTIFSDVSDKKVFFLEVRNSDISVFLGIGARTPLHAVLSAPGQ